MHYTNTHIELNAAPELKQHRMLVAHSTVYVHTCGDALCTHVPCHMDHRSSAEMQPVGCKIYGHRATMLVAQVMAI